jgi:hypothetical protein
VLPSANSETSHLHDNETLGSQPRSLICSGWRTHLAVFFSMHLIGGCSAGPAQGSAKQTAPVDIAVVEDVGNASEDKMIPIRDLVAASAGWPRVTTEARDKITLCAPASPIDARPDSEHRVGEKFHTYVNEGQSEYVAGRPMPDGSVIVKRTFLPATGETTAYFLMMKNENDWRYATAGADGARMREGELPDCVSCHQKQVAADYLFRKF